VKPRWFLEAAGASLLLLLPYFFPLVLPSEAVLYHHHLPLTNVVRGLLLDLVGALILGVALIALLYRLPPVPRRVIGACLAGLVFWRFAGDFLFLVQQWRAAQRYLDSPTDSGFYRVTSTLWNSSAHPLAVCLILLFAALAWFEPAASHSAVRAARLGLAGFAFISLWIVPPLFSLAFLPHTLPKVQAASAQPADSMKKRIVWILFDELSYDLVYDHRPAGLKLPNLDKLHATSVSFGKLEPAGYFTERVIPSLLAGQPIDQIRSDLDGGLSYVDQTQHEWRNYDPHKTLLGLAQANGWNPGVSGWYNPYCRLFATVLTSCYWRPEALAKLRMETEGASARKSSLMNALVLPHMFLTKLSPNATTDKTHLEARRIRDYRRLMEHATALIQDGQVHFLFLHLPVPHPPGIYDRRTHQFSESGNYLDNLVLADDTLGALMQEIDHTPSADQTTVIVSSDHSWRVPMWRGASGWTDEEEHISRGRFDARPVFLIHFPGQSSGNEVPGPLPELAEHDIMAEMLGLKVTNPETLNAFLFSPAQQQVDSNQRQPPPLQ
jgi:Sulfatase